MNIAHNRVPEPTAIPGKFMYASTIQQTTSPPPSTMLRDLISSRFEYSRGISCDATPEAQDLLRSQELFLSVVLDWQRQEQKAEASEQDTIVHSSPPLKHEPLYSSSFDSSEGSDHEGSHALLKLTKSTRSSKVPTGDPSPTNIAKVHYVPTNLQVPALNLNNILPIPSKKIGVYTPRSRRVLIEKYMEKRTKRLSRKKVRYRVRKTLANARPRVKGRFVKTEQPLTAAAVEEMEKRQMQITSKQELDMDHHQTFIKLEKQTRSDVSDILNSITTQYRRRGRDINWEDWASQLESSMGSLLPKQYHDSPIPDVFNELINLLADAEEDNSQPTYLRALHGCAIYVVLCISLYISQRHPSIWESDPTVSALLEHYLVDIKALWTRRKTKKQQTLEAFEGTMEEKVLRRRPGDRLGMTLISLESGVPGSIFVSSVLPDTPSERAGICVGWELMSIEKQSAEVLTVESIGHIVARTKGDIRVVFQTTPSQRFLTWQKKASNTGTTTKATKKKAHEEQQKKRKHANAKKHKDDDANTNESENADDKHEETPTKNKHTTPSKRKVKLAAPPTNDETSESEQSPRKKTPKVARGQRSISDFVVPTPPVSSPPRVEAAGTTRQSRAEHAKMNMVVQRLMTMGFKREDALLSYEKVGPSTDACMLWLVSYIEEKKFQNDMNKAQIASELQKRTEDSQHKEKVEEVIRETSSLRTLFAQSLVFIEASNVGTLQNFLDSEMTTVSADNKLRQHFVELFTLETKAKKWYGKPAECYIVQLLKSIESTLEQHDLKKCTCLNTVQDNCGLVKAVAKEIADLKHHMFDMPTNCGGIPEAFIKADESLHFSLEDDGFEVIEVEQEETHDVE
ncbi:hypothetical protein THRCLA_11603 [Thraustotheca clavata]|uniref:PDZ domain-containing protein n=1 Tax=Thraustotheca clavata TaxID=74557 RepID=A0A1V9Y779_9STRA|nr:hypothetical protein THRCLA_11603 [Thraustotheca clavata]